MIRRAVPVRFDRVAESGRNKPLRIALQTDDGVEHEGFLKCSGRPELGIEGLANELLAAMLAGDLGLPVNEPFLVDLTTDWVESVQDEGIRQVLRASAPVAFASEAAGPQWKVWSPSDTLSAVNIPDALAILAFDAYIENDDRKVGNSNCLVKGRAFRIIDHELAFRIRQKLFPPPHPWSNGYLQRFVAPDGHIFGARLRGAVVDTGPVRSAWLTLPDERLQSYLSEMPAEWSAANQAMEAALTHLRDVRDKIDNCLAELRRALT